MEELNLNKKVYSKNNYVKVIDTNFTQLVSTPSLTNNVTALSAPSSPPSPSISVDQFFNNYNEIFFTIPKTGNNSHETLINQSSEYINFDPINSNIQALIEEINALQQQNLELTKQIYELQTSSSMA